MSKNMEFYQDLKFPALKILRDARDDKTTERYISVTVQRHIDEYAATLFVGGMVFPLVELSGMWVNHEWYGQIHVPYPESLSTPIGDFPFGMFVDTEDPRHIFMCCENSSGQPMFNFASKFILFAKHCRYYFILTASPEKGFHFAYTDEPTLQKTFDLFVPLAQQLEYENARKKLETDRKEQKND